MAIPRTHQIRALKAADLFSMLAGDARFGVINPRLPPMMVRTKLQARQ
jgi:hypothetical protein